MGLLFDKIKELLSEEIANHQIIELLVFLSELAHAGVIDANPFS